MNFITGSSPAQLWRAGANATVISEYLHWICTSCSTMRPTRADGYLLGPYRIATAPEPNSSRPTSLKSRCFDSPANNVGPRPASLGCTTNSLIHPANGYLLGSYRMATAPEPNSRRLTSLKSIRFDSPANNVGP